MRHLTAVILAGGLAFGIGGCGHAEERPKDDVSSPADMSEFLAHPESCKGRTVTMNMEYEGPTPLTHAQIKKAGGKVPFERGGYVDGAHFKLIVEITVPPEVPIPRIEADTVKDVVVTFTCTEGSLKQGNIAQEIRRPAGLVTE